MSEEELYQQAMRFLWLGGQGSYRIVVSTPTRNAFYDILASVSARTHWPVEINEDALGNIYFAPEEEAE